MIFAFVARSLQQVSTLVMTILAARFLVPAEYGIYTLAIVFITLVQTMSYTGVFHYLIASKQDRGPLTATAFWLMLAMASAAALILAVLAYPLAALFRADDLGPVLLLLALLQPFAGVTAWFNAILLRDEAMKKHFGIMFAQNLIALIGGVALLLSWQSLFALVAFRAVRVFTGLLLYISLLRERPAWHFDISLAREGLVFSRGLYGSRVLNFLSRYAGDLLLGIIFTSAEAGLYRFGGRVAGGATDVVAQPMRSFALSRFAAEGRRDGPLENLLALYAGSMTLLIGGVAAVVVVFAEVSVAAFFDAGYLAAVGVAIAMAFRAVVSLGWSLLEPVFVAVDKTDAIMRFNMVWMIAIVGGVLVAAPFGLDVLAWSQMALNLLASLAAFSMIQKVAGVSMKPAAVSTTRAGILVIAYALILWATWEFLAQAVGAEGGWAILVGLIWSIFLSVPILLIGQRLKVFSLSIFIG
ncbi:MAG: oligosaccharide flippase family protein [Pseudomonadota bacterium]